MGKGEQEQGTQEAGKGTDPLVVLLLEKAVGRWIKLGITGYSKT